VAFDSAKPRAAAALFKINSRRGEMLKWLEDRLKSGEPYQRRVAAKVFGSLEGLAKPARPKLKAALDDVDPTVRVFAAVSVWKIDRDPAPVLPVLRKALFERTVAADTVPITISEDTEITQKYYAIRCLVEIGHQASAAADDIAQVLNDGDEVLPKLEGATALAEIGQATPNVIAALHKLEQNPIADVAESATSALEKLNRGK
jgi:HEAT repeat protein